MLEAYVIFSKSDKPYLRGLKQGFRHVTIVLELLNSAGDGKGFVHVDPRAPVIELQHVNMSDIGLMDLKARAFGITILRTHTRPIKECPRLGFYSCVGTVKKLLGIQAWWVLTPYQLYKYLNKTQGDYYGR